MGCGNNDKFRNDQPSHIIEALSTVLAAITRDMAFEQLNKAHRSNVLMTSEDWEAYKNLTDIPECYTPQV